MMTRTTQLRPQYFFLVLVAFVAVWLSSAPSRPPASSHYNIHQVSVPQARALMDAGALVIDVRGQEAYGHRHLPGAVSLPLEQLQQGIPISIESAKAKSIVVYCGDGATHGPEATQLLNRAGYAGAVNLQSGLEGWVAAGMPIQTGVGS